MPSDIFDWLPFVLNTGATEGFSRSLNQFDYNASGRSTWNALQAKISEFLETNILSGKSRWKAQILSETEIDISQGDLAWYNLGDSTTKRVGYRVRIPELHQMIPFPYDDKYVDDSLVYEIMHPVAIFAMGKFTALTGIGGFKKGDLVWVRFEAGFGNKRFLYPVITGLCDDMEGTGQVTGGGLNGTGATDTGTAASDSTSSLFGSGADYNIDLNPMSSSDLSALIGSDYDPAAAKSVKAARLYGKLVNAGFTENEALGLVANASAESSYNPAINGDYRGNLSAGYVVDGIQPDGAFGEYCSWGLWQNNVCDNGGGGFSMLKYFTKQDGTTDGTEEGLKAYASASEENQQHLLSILVNEDKQIEWIKNIASSLNYSQYAVNYTSDAGNVFEGSAAATVFWLQKYERPTGYNTTSKENERLLHLQYAVQDINSQTASS